jgi:hypothetical protein
MKAIHETVTLPQESKSIIDYYGLVLYFDTTITTPLTVFAAVLDRRSACKIVFKKGLYKGLDFFDTETETGLTNDEKSQFKQLVENNLDDLVRGWVDYFVFNREPNVDIVTKSLNA